MYIILKRSEKCIRLAGDILFFPLLIPPSTDIKTLPRFQVIRKVQLFTPMKQKQILIYIHKKNLKLLIAFFFFFSKKLNKRVSMAQLLKYYAGFCILI